LRFAAFIKPVESTALNAIKDKKARDPIVKSIESRKVSAKDIQASMDLTNKQFQKQAFIENWVANKRFEMPDAPMGPGLPDILGAALTGALGGAFGVRSNVAGQTLDVMGARQQTDYANEVAKIQNQQRETQDFLKRSGGIRDDMARQFNTQADDLRLLENSIADDEMALYKFDQGAQDKKDLLKLTQKYKLDLAEITGRVGTIRQLEEIGMSRDQATKLVFAKENKDIAAAENDKRETDIRIGRLKSATKLDDARAAKLDEETRLLPEALKARYTASRARTLRGSTPRTSVELNEKRKDYVSLLQNLEENVSVREKEANDLRNRLGALLEVQAATAFTGKPAVDQKTLEDLKFQVSNADSRLEKAKKALDNMKVERNDALRNAGKGMVTTATTAAGFKPGAVCTDATDCSMFAQRAMANMGLKVPPTTATQIKAGKSLVGKGGTAKDLAPGDLVFFATQGNGQVSHVGVYVGDGKFRHASSTGKRGPSRNKGLQYMYKEEKLEDYMKRFPLVDIRRYSA
jgi:cell wall-associated NlpC family hydrolase